EECLAVFLHARFGYRDVPPLLRSDQIVVWSSGGQRLGNSCDEAVVEIAPQVAALHERGHPQERGYHGLPPHASFPRICAFSTCRSRLSMLLCALSTSLSCNVRSSAW